MLFYDMNSAWILGYMSVPDSLTIRTCARHFLSFKMLSHRGLTS